MLSGVWILIGETFPTRTRAKQGSLSTAANWTWNFLLAFFTPFISSAIDYRYGYVFAGASSFFLVLQRKLTKTRTACNLTGAVVVYLFLYESSDISLENVDMVRARLGSSRLLTRVDRCTLIRSVNRGRLVVGHRPATCPVKISSCGQGVRRSKNRMGSGWWKGASDEVSVCIFRGAAVAVIYRPPSNQLYCV